MRHAEDLPPETAAPGEESGARAADGSDDAGAAAPDDGDFAPERRLPVPQVRRLPDGLPAVEVNIVQWSPSAERRFAFVRVDGSTMVKVREGDEVGGLRVVRIHPEGVELAQDDARWILRTD